jgi:hypothetical protein
LITLLYEGDRAQEFKRDVTATTPFDGLKPILRAMGVVVTNARGPEEQSFFAAFCSQKEVLRL